MVGGCALVRVLGGGALPLAWRLQAGQPFLLCSSAACLWTCLGLATPGCSS